MGDLKWCIGTQADPIDFQMNVCNSLSNTKSTVASMTCKKGITWPRIVAWLYNKYKEPCKKDAEGDIKDTYGVNFNHFKFLTREDVNQELFKKAADQERILGNPKSSVESIKKAKFKLKNISTLEKRAQVVKDIFKTVPDDQKERGSSLRRKKFLGSSKEETIRSLFLDYDNDQPPYKSPARVIRILNELNISFIAYSSFSSSLQKPKFRVVIPYLRPADKEEHECIAEYILYFLNDEEYSDIKKFRIDTTCLQPIRFFYVPNVPTLSKKYEDNLPHNDGAWFYNKDIGVYLDPDKACKRRFIDIKLGYKIFSLPTLKAIIKEESKKLNKKIEEVEDE